MNISNEIKILKGVWTEAILYSETKASLLRIKEKNSEK
jgi:hypothetical protein